jgi:hypothetical protein
MIVLIVFISTDRYLTFLPILKRYKKLLLICTILYKSVRNCYTEKKTEFFLISIWRKCLVNCMITNHIDLMVFFWIDRKLNGFVQLYKNTYTTFILIRINIRTKKNGYELFPKIRTNILANPYSWSLLICILILYCLVRFVLWFSIFFHQISMH